MGIYYFQAVIERCSVATARRKKKRDKEERVRKRGRKWSRERKK